MKIFEYPVRKGGKKPVRKAVDHVKLVINCGKKESEEQGSNPGEAIIQKEVFPSKFDGCCENRFLP